jgi:hypothetical protein
MDKLDQAEAIFLPFLGMMVLTMIVWIAMYVRRIGYMKKQRVNPQQMTTPEKGKALLSEYVNYPAFNLSNLFELPVLFYALCLYLYVTGSVDDIYVAAAWIFFLFRVLHSAVHVSTNRVIVRFWLYATASLALWFMLCRVLFSLLAAAYFR